MVAPSTSVHQIRPKALVPIPAVGAVPLATVIVVKLPDPGGAWYKEERAQTN